jgi:hypothetical protein
MCIPSSCADGQLTPESAQTFQALGLSLDAYAIMNVVFLVIQALVYYLIAAVIFWQRPDEWLAVIVVLGFLAAPTNSLSQPVTAVPPVFPGALACVQYLGIATFILIAFLFPNGRFVPRWTLPFAAVGLVNVGVQTFLPDVVWPLVFAGSNWVIGFSLLVFAQIYRYRKVSSREQRQQTKWFVFGLTGTLMLNLVYRLLPLLFPLFAQQNTLYAFISGTISSYSFLLIPLTIGFAILRYKLWDIDLIINRTLVYSTLTAILALIYLGCVVLLQHLVNGVTGQVGQFPLVIVASTLAIAALFQPLRRRIQKIIDKRFYRRKYDAERILADFSATLRNEMDLSQLREQLVDVVQETMQPTHVSLWLRKPEQERKHSTKDF